MRSRPSRSPSCSSRSFQFSRVIAGDIDDQFIDPAPILVVKCRDMLQPIHLDRPAKSRVLGPGGGVRDPAYSDRVHDFSDPLLPRFR